MHERQRQAERAESKQSVLVVVHARPFPLCPVSMPAFRIRQAAGLALLLRRHSAAARCFPLAPSLQCRRSHLDRAVQPRDGRRRWCVSRHRGADEVGASPAMLQRGRITAPLALAYGFPGTQARGQCPSGLSTGSTGVLRSSARDTRIFGRSLPTQHAGVRRGEARLLLWHLSRRAV